MKRIQSDALMQKEKASSYEMDARKSTDNCTQNEMKIINDKEIWNKF